MKELSNVSLYVLLDIMDTIKFATQTVQPWVQLYLPMTQLTYVFKHVRMELMEIFQLENVYTYVQSQRILLQMIALDCVNKNANKQDFMQMNPQGSVFKNVHKFQHYMESFLKKYV